MQQEMRAGELAALADERRAIDLLDVRTPAEFQHAHVAFARNVPLEQLDPELVMRWRPAAPADPVYVLCQSGSRATAACERLQSAGVTQVVQITDGVEGCAAAGLPMIYGRERVSIERQVRIVAGSLVLIGLSLATLVHPLFSALSAVVGAGLVFAGVTDFCGLALLLARMPWNKRSGSARSAPHMCKSQTRAVDG
ncbi:MAG: rhodanese-like domain-containing protein [Pirellulaceae bacterium]|jgi:rhodanese-related sulfurtransferase|nr:rhodanese-like domain-containing protein [Pirellulaceae bacterium]